MKKLLAILFLSACAGAGWTPPSGFDYVPIKTKNYEIATWQKINNPIGNRIHIYIEGDGNAYDSYGIPTSDPTPRGTFVRDLASKDDFENVVYMARPCQFIMNQSCTESDWTDGRFSQKIIDAQTDALKQIAKNKKIILIGYSGGALVSGLIIEQNPKMDFEKWVTVAGVLNHKQWTQYFGDKPLTKSINMQKLPDLPQIHYVGKSDKIVPYTLSEQWVNESDIRLIDKATHDDFGNLRIFD